jgi:hypothetical protein
MLQCEPIAGRLVKSDGLKPLRIKLGENSMLTRGWLRVSIWLALSAVASAQQPFEAGKGVPPALGQARANKEADVIDVGRPTVVTRQEVYTVLRPVSRTVEIDGQQVTRIDMVPETRTKVVTETVQIFGQVPVEDVQVYDLAWKPVAVEKFRAKLTDKPTSILLVERGGGTYSPRFDPAFLDIVKEGTFIIIVPKK